MGFAADVIHSVAFDNELSALDLHKLPNGDFGFSEIPYLQVSYNFCDKHSQAASFSATHSRC